MKSFARSVMSMVCFAVALTSFIACEALDSADEVVGIYYGTGSLEKSGTVFETYPTMVINITYEGFNQVKVTPFTASGTPFFSSGEGVIYRVIKVSSKGYTLQLPNDGHGQCDISHTGQLILDYPNVQSVTNGGGFSLKFTGVRR